MADNIFQQNVSNLYGASLQAEYDKEAALNAERRRTQGIANLVRVMRGQSPDFSSAGYTGDSSTSLPKREEIEASQFIQQIQEEGGGLNPYEMGQRASDVGLSIGALDKVKDVTKMFDPGKRVQLWNVDKLGQATPSNVYVNENEREKIQSYTNQGYFESESAAKAAGFSSIANEVNSRWVSFIQGKKDVTQQDVEQFKRANQELWRSDNAVAALKNVVEGYDLENPVRRYRSSDGKRVITVGRAEWPSYENNPDWVQTDDKAIVEEGQRLIESNQRDKVVDALHSVPGFMSMPPEVQRELAKNMMTLVGMELGDNSANLDSVMAQSGQGIMAANSREDISARASTLRQQLLDVTNAGEYDAILKELIKVQKDAAEHGTDFSNSIQNITGTLKDLEAKPVSAQERLQVPMGSGQGYVTLERDYLVNPINGKRMAVGEPRKVISENDTVIESQLYNENGTPKLNENGSPIYDKHYTYKVFNDNLKQLEPMKSNDSVDRLGKITTVYDYALAPLNKMNDDPGNYGLMDSNLIMALYKSRDDSLVSISEVEAISNLQGVPELLALWRSKISDAPAAISPRMRRAIMTILGGIYDSAHQTAMPLYARQKIRMHKLFGDKFQYAPPSSGVRYSEGGFDDMAASAGINPDIFSRKRKNYLEVMKGFKNYFALEDGFNAKNIIDGF
jgi:hypothetical protein